MQALANTRIYRNVNAAHAIIFKALLSQHADTHRWTRTSRKTSMNKGEIQERISLSGNAPTVTQPVTGVTSASHTQ